MCGTDCDDAAGAIHPTQIDVCNDLDDDCDDNVDEGALRPTFTADCDGDMHGALGGETVSECAAPAGPPPSCAAGADRARWAELADDCDDGDGARYPGAMEICDGVDNDCDGALDGPDEDDDVDGYADACAGAGARDCNDGCPTCFPGGPTPAACDALDHDCDGSVDEGTLHTWYRDADGDGIGDGAAATASACLAPGGYVAGAGDCNDAEMLTGTCGAPISCVRGACGCSVALLHGRDYLDLDGGVVTMTGAPSSVSDIYPEWAGDPTMPPIPWYVRVRTGVQHQHLPGRSFASVTAADATALQTLPIDQRFTTDRVIIVRSNAGVLYKLGLPRRVTIGGFDTLELVYAPLGAPPAGFRCP
jgi:hypothetical protein